MQGSLTSGANEVQERAVALDESTDGRFRFVVIDTNMGWRVERYDRDGTAAGAATFAGNFATDVRGAATLGNDAVLLTLADRIMRADFAPNADGTSNIGTSTVLTGLENAYGMARHPFLPGVLYVAEKDQHKVLRVDVDTERKGLALARDEAGASRSRTPPTSPSRPPVTGS